MMNQEEGCSPQGDVSLSSFLEVCGQSTHVPCHVDENSVRGEIDAYCYIFALAKNRLRKESVTLLEVGCGTGRLGYHFSCRPEVLFYTGVDVVSDYVAYFRQYSPSLDIREISIFQLREENFDIAVVPFTTLHLFNFEIQEVLIRKLLTFHSGIVCFDVFFPDWGGYTSRWSGLVTETSSGYTHTRMFYAMPKSEYYALARSLGVEIVEHTYFRESREGKRTQHVLVTFLKSSQLS